MAAVFDEFASRSMDEYYSVLEEKVVEQESNIKKMSESRSLPSHLINKLQELSSKTQSYETCAICLESIRENLHVTNCGHFFHSECWGKHIESSGDDVKKCPSCRQI